MNRFYKMEYHLIPSIGEQINDIISDAVRLSKQYSRDHIVVFNEVRLTTTPLSNASEIVDKYYKTLKKQSKKQTKKETTLLCEIFRIDNKKRMLSDTIKMVVDIFETHDFYWNTGFNRHEIMTVVFDLIDNKFIFGCSDSVARRCDDINDLDNIVIKRKETK